MKHNNIWSVTTTNLFIMLMSISFCSKLNDQIASPVVIGNYKWEQVLPFGNGSFQEEWKPGTFPLGITPMIAFHENLWMVGQKAAWFSSDGLRWTKQTKTDWGERISMAYVYYADKLWMFGGMKYQEKQFVNDVWFSADGINWQQGNNAEWQPREGHKIIIFKNKLWLFGGAIEVLADRTPSKFLNDVWSSLDGLHWTEELHTAPWSPRDNPQVVVFRDTLYMLGGQGQADIWRSADGKNWSQLITEAGWQKRYDNGALVFDGKMWIFGGRDTSNNHNTAAKNDVWFSDNGINWEQQTNHAPWTVRSGGTSVIFENKLWIFSGKHTGGRYNWGGDIWTMSLVR